MKKGFTLIEMLVVVLIIGILAGIALPQYQMAVTKAKVASILPLMRRWKDALYEYKLQHGNYGTYEEGLPDGATLSVNWPSDWKDINIQDKLCGDATDCYNDSYRCSMNLEETGYVSCQLRTNDGSFEIYMYQPDDPDYVNFRGKITCWANGVKAHQVCKALGGKLPAGEDSEYILY